jgi:hypothetical protein
MNRHALTAYLCSLPERVVRSASALAGGMARELGEVTLPARVRRTRLYQTLVDSTLRFLIEQVGQVEGAYGKQAELPKDFLVRRTAGNVLEVAGFVAFRASPVWVLAALADVSGAGRDLVADIAETLKKEGLLEPEQRFENVDQMLDGFERTAGRLAEAVNTPPLDVETLRREWTALRTEVGQIPRAMLPSPSLLRSEWQELKQEAAAQERSVFELSTIMPVSAIRRLPENVRWLSRAAGIGARRTGQVVAQGLLDHYRETLEEIRKTGYLRYWYREFRPYLVGAVEQFSPQRDSLTARLLARRRAGRKGG